MDIFALIFIIFLVVAAIRYFVWRNRHMRITAQLGSLSAEVARLAAKIAAQPAAVSAARGGALITAFDAAGKTRSSPVTAPSEPIAPIVSPSASAWEAMNRNVTEGQSARAISLPESPRLAESFAKRTDEEQSSKDPAVDSGQAELAPGARRAAVAPTKARPPKPFLGTLIRAALERMGGEAELEALIGGSWLNKLGVVALVIGMALLARYTLAYVGPAGKVALGVGASVALLLAGVWLERRKRYMLFARPLIGGGWALLYFTAYAAYNIDATRLIDNPIVGLAALLAVAAGMIAHSLKYRSEIVTGLAYALAFVAIDINPLSLYSLFASALLAASLVSLLTRLPWYRLTLGGIAATYLTHFLGTMANASAGSVTPSAFWFAEGTLILYWLIFAACDFLRAPQEGAEKQLAATVSVANAVLFAVLSAILVEHAYPHEFHILAGLAALAYGAMSWLLARCRRRVPYLAYGSFAVALAALAAPLALPQWKIAGEWLPVAWGALAAGAFALGLRRQEIIFRAQSYLLLLAASAAALMVSIFHIPTGDIVAADLAMLRWITVALVITALFAFEWVILRVRDQLPPQEQELGLVAGYLAVGLLTCLIWRDSSVVYLGLAWLGVAILFTEFGLRAGHAPMRHRAYLLMALALAALIFNNANLLVPPSESLDARYRWMVLTIAVIGFYFVGWRLKSVAARIAKPEALLYPLIAHAGALLLGALLWNELAPAAVAVAWGLLALILYETGAWLPERALRLQGYAFALLAWGRLFLVDFIALGAVGPISTRVLTVIPVAALLYYLRHALPADTARYERSAFEARLPILYSFAATLALMVLARFELGRAEAVMAWAALAFGLLWIGVWRAAWDYRIGAYLVVLAAFARSLTTNFYLEGSFHGLPLRIATTVPVIVVLFATGLLWRRRRAAPAASAPPGLPHAIRWIDANVAFLCGLGVVLLAALLYHSVAGNVLTIAWAVEGLAATAAGFLLRERTLRLSGLALLAVCLLKGSIIDLQGVEPIYRILSFIVLGLILLSISFVYTKYRHVLKAYI